MESLSTIAGIEDSFSRIQLLGTEPICFAVQMESTLLSSFGAVGALAENKRNQGVQGYLLNRNERGIVLIPIVSQGLWKNRTDFENYVMLEANDISEVKVKKDFMYWRIHIMTKNHVKYQLRVIAKVKGEPRHEANVKAFIALYR